MATSVRDVMTGNPRSVGISASVVEAARLMRDEDIGSLPVTDGETLVGMITDRDITTRVVAEAADPQTTSVGDVSSRDVISLGPEDDLDEALGLMARHQVRRLTVVENGMLIGIVAQADIALRENETKTGQLVEAISEPSAGDAPLASPRRRVRLRARSPRRLPLLEALRDERRPLRLVRAVQHLEVRGVGAEVDAGGSRMFNAGSRSDRVIQYPMARSALSTLISPVPSSCGAFGCRGRSPFQK